MRCLLLTLGSRGDVQPFVALGLALAARGHTVTVSTSRSFEALIQGHGLAMAPLTIDIQALLEQPDMRAAMTSLRGWLAAFRASRDLMQRQLDEIGEIARAAAPEVIVHHPKALTAPWLARVLGAVAIPAFLQPAYGPTGAFANPLLPLPDLGTVGNRLGGRAMAALLRLGTGAVLRPWLRRHPDIPVRPRLDALDGYHPQGRAVPRLHAHSRHLVPKPADWGPRDHVTGAWVLPPTDVWQPSSDLAAFLAAGPPPVFVGFGSMPAVDAGRTAAVMLAALTHTGTRAVLATGGGALCEAAAAADPAQVHVLDAAPHDRLFPLCRAVIHHGGAGTTHTALRCGRPSWLCPVFGDQPFWGRVVARLGAGPAPVPLRRLTERRVETALQALTSGVFDETAHRLGQALSTDTGADTAAALIEAAALPV